MREKNRHSDSFDKQRYSVLTEHGRLANTLRSNKERIISIWEDRTHRLITAARNMEPLALRDSLPKMLDELVRAMEGSDSEHQLRQEESFLATEHGRVRSQQPGFNLAQIVEEYFILRQIIFEVLEQDSEIPSTARDIILEAIAIGIRNATVEFSRRKLFEAKQSSLKLKASEEQFKLLVEGMKDHAIIRMDCEGNIIFWSPGAENIFGWKSGEVVGKKASFLATPDDVLKETQLKEMKTAIAAKKVEIERWHLRKDGTHLFAVGIMNPLFNEQGKHIGFIKALRDNSEQRALENQIATNEQRLEMTTQWLVAVLEQMPAGVSIYEAPSGKAILHNKKAKELFGPKLKLKKNDPQNQEFGAFHSNGVPYRQEEYPTYRALRNGETIINEEMRYRRTDGSYTFFSVSASPIKNEENNILGAVATFFDITQRKLSEQALEKSESRLQVATNDTKIGVWEYDIQTGKMWRTKSHDKLYGIKHFNPNMEAKIFFERIHPEDHQKLSDEFEKAVAKKKSYNIPYRVYLPNGSMRWLMNCGKPIQDSNGDTVRILGTVRDITEEIETRNLIMESEAWARQIANSLPIMVWTAKPDGKIDWYNDWWYDYIGKSRDGNIKRLEAAIHPDDLDSSKACWDSAFAEGRPFIFEQRFLRHSDGVYRWHLVHGVPVKDSSGLVSKYIGGNTDIHDQKMLAEKLAQAKGDLEVERKNFESLFDQSSGFVAILSGPDFIYEYLNETTKQIMGGNNTGRSLKKILLENNRTDILDMFERVYKTGQQEFVQELEWKTGDDVRYYNCTYVARRDKNDKINGVMIWGLDITDQIKSRKNLELSESRYKEAKQLAEAANSAKSRFLANMSHEIRTPMNAVLGFTEILKDPTLSDSERSDAISRIDNSGKFLLRLIDDILDISKIEAGRMEILKTKFSPASVVTEIISLMKITAERKGIGLKLELQPGLPEQATSDPGRIRQILVNLIGNAIKFTSVGEVIVKIEARDSKFLIFTVSDTGIGISKNDVKNLFKPFAQADGSITRKFGGTGLGLVLSRRLAETLGGSLEISKSEIGRGTSFIVKVQADPFSYEKLALQPTDVLSQLQTEGHHDLQEVEVLLAEDVPDNQILVKRYLEKAGANVFVVSNGAEAIKVALKKDFDIVLMDIQMPMVDGIQASRELRARGFDKPIIALTAHAMAEEVKKSLEAGCNAHLTKPINRTVLVEAIYKFLNS